MSISDLKCRLARLERHTVKDNAGMRAVERAMASLSTDDWGLL